MNYIRRQAVLYRLFFKNYFFTGQGPFFAFILPLFLEVIVYIVFRGAVASGHATTGSQIEGLILLPACTTGLISLSVCIGEWKNSILLKRISATPLTKAEFILALLGFFTIVALVGIVWAFFWAYIILLVDKKDSVMKNINYGWLILSAVLVSSLSISMGILVGGLCSNETTAEAVGLTIYFPLVFMGGIMLPLYLLDKSEGMRIFTYFIPFKYSSFVNSLAWQNGSLEQYNQITHNIGNYKEFNALWQAPVFSVLWTGLFTGISIRLFKL